jgi:hypothetical protein
MPQRHEHDEAGTGALLGEVVGTADTGDASADDHHAEMLGHLERLHGARIHDARL